MSIQQAMVDKHKSLTQNQAGIELESEFRKQRELFKKEMAEARDLWRQALKYRDQESTEMLRDVEAEIYVKVDPLIEEREHLEVSMEQIYAEQYASLEEIMRIDKLDYDDRRR